MLPWSGEHSGSHSGGEAGGHKHSRGQEPPRPHLAHLASQGATGKVRGKGNNVPARHCHMNSTCITSFNSQNDPRYYRSVSILILKKGKTGP